MGAGDHHRPGPDPTGQPVPSCGNDCDEYSPRKSVLPSTPDGVPRSRPWVGQVAAPTSYAVAGKVLLTSAGAFAGILLALVALHMYNNGRRGRAQQTRRRLLRSAAIVADDERDGGAAPAPRGLDPAVLMALPVAAAGPGAGECAVCLAELEPADPARALPRCGHRFHVECIDAWFRGNSTCPLCRADVEAPAAEAQLPEVRVDVDAAVKVDGVLPAMGRLPSGTDLDKTRRVLSPTRSAYF